MALEIEKTYLAKALPPDLTGAPYDEIEDVYLFQADGLGVRARRKGEQCEFTIKKRVGADASRNHETTIDLTRSQYDDVTHGEATRLRKHRYYYPYHRRTAEVDVFLDELKGLVVIEFEFSSVEEKDAFPVPEFCLADVTFEKFIVGGNLAGKTYGVVEADLKRFHYQSLALE